VGLKKKKLPMVCPTKKKSARERAPNGLEKEKKLDKPKKEGVIGKVGGELALPHKVRGLGPKRVNQGMGFPKGQPIKWKLLAKKPHDRRKVNPKKKSGRKVPL